MLLKPFNGQILNKKKIQEMLTSEEDLYSKNTSFADYNLVKYKILKRISHCSYLIDIPEKEKSK